MALIQSSIQFNSKPIDDLIGYLDSYAQVVDEEFDAAFNQIEKPLLDDLHYEPAQLSYPSDYPREWASEKQRRAFWASDGFGGGIPTVRTHALVKAWSFIKQGSGLNIVAKVNNNNPASKWVYGSLSLSNRGADQQKLHVQGGWPQQGATIDYWFKALIEQFVSNMNIRLGDVVGQTKTQRRSYTTPRSR